MASIYPFRVGLLTVVAVVLVTPVSVEAQWSAQPGEAVRNAFGPERGGGAKMCRGACGAGCPGTCDRSVSYECLDESLLRRVRSYRCGTHQGCQEHDDCLDRCSLEQAEGFDCQAQCHSEAMERFGFESATSWATGAGPYDGPRITFEYTRDQPDHPEPAFRCPSGTRLECTAGNGRCIGAGGSSLNPVFDSYPSAGSAGMRVWDFRSGRLCGNSVCKQDSVIQITGQDTCERGNCTRFGMEFDYANADPSAPLECSSLVSGGSGDFVADLLKKVADAAPQQGDGSGQDGMAELLGVFQKVLQSADSPEDLKISLAPLGPDGKPIESQRVGSQDPGPPPVPRSIDLPGVSGRLVVPMYQLAGGSSRGAVVREIRCTHKGVPVLETSVQLQF